MTVPRRRPAWVHDGAVTVREASFHPLRMPLQTKQSPFANRRRSLAGMANDTLAEIISAVRKRPYSGRGDIYRMLRANYRELATCLGEGEPSWRVIAEALEREGIVGRAGNPPTRKSLPRVWQRVCRDVAAEEALRLTGVRPANSHAEARLLQPGVPRVSPNRMRHSRQGVSIRAATRLPCLPCRSSGRHRPRQRGPPRTAAGLLLDLPQPCARR